MSMEHWRWIDKQLLIALHDESLVLHGGASGVRDEGLLDSAINRAKHLALYGDPDYADLAAAYVFGLTSNHPFIDGNKRAAFLSLGLFLGLNGYRLNASQVNATLTMMSVAAGEMTETAFSAWVRLNSISRN